MITESNARHHMQENSGFIEIGETERKIPVYDLRNKSHHEQIAKGFASGAKIAMFGGVWGVFKGVLEDSIGEDYFHTVKKGRPKEAKIAMLITPEISVNLIDWNKVHPQFRNLQVRSEYEKLWNSHGAFVHIIGPVNPYKAIPRVFQTTPEDYSLRYPNAKPIQDTTACFIWRNDPFLESIDDLTRIISKYKSYIGVSTLNAHGQEPPYTYEELKSYLKDGKIDSKEIDLVVRDSIYETQEVSFGSHTQIRLPHIQEEPVLKVVRLGSLSVEGFGNATGHKLEIIPGVKDVRRNPGENIDQILLEMSDKIRLANKGKK